MRRSIKHGHVLMALALNLGVVRLAHAKPLTESDDAELWEKLSEQHGCKNAETLCLRGDGALMSGDVLPRNIAQGTSVTVKVIGCKAVFKKVKFEIGLESLGSGDQLFRTGGSGRAPLVEESDECGEEANYVVLDSATMTVPGSVAKIAISFKRVDVDGNEYTHSYEAKVIRGLYFLDVSFAAPFVIGGDRKITAVNDPSVALRRLELEQDLLIKPAVMLNVFPGGRRLGALTSFAADRNCRSDAVALPESPTITSTTTTITKSGDTTTTSTTTATTPAASVAATPPANDAIKKCRSHNVARGFANSLGLQFGLGLDTDSFGKQFYMGGMFEPVVGLNLGFGLALIRGEYYRDGFTDGQLIGADVGADEWRREKMMARPYFSISFSLDIIRNVRAAMDNPEITSLRSNPDSG